MARYGFDFPPFGDLADPRPMADVAHRAERAGWDGVFVWDHVTYRSPVTHVGDPWIGLAAMANATERVALGVMVSPLPRRRPQIVARQSVALDLLSDGRFVLGVGIGLDSSGRELSAFGEEFEDRSRGAMLDESLEVIRGLWSGERYSFDGEHYLVDDVAFLPRPLSQPHPPVWVAARWPYRRPLRRAASWDGLFLIDQEHPDQLAEAAAHVEGERGNLEGFDIVTHLEIDSDPGPWIAAGATWLLTKIPYDAASPEIVAIAAAGPWA